MTHGPRTLLSIAAAGALLAATPAAWAQESDGAYGRLEGDLLLEAGAGVGIVTGGPQITFELEALYLSTAGVYVAYQNTLGGSAYDRFLGFGVELKPVFLGRYALDLAQGPAFLDLLVDSFSLQLGAVYRGEGSIGGVATDAGFGVEFGAGIEIPLYPAASSPYLGTKGILRWFDDDAGGDIDVIEAGSTLVFTLAWHQILDVGIVDANDTYLEAKNDGRPPSF